VNAVQLNRRHNGLHESDRNMDTSRISARTDVPLPDQEMHVAQLSTREGEDSEVGQVDPTQATARRRDGSTSTFPFGEMNSPAVPKVL